MKAITTKYIGPTNYRGSRIKATDDAGNSITIGYDSVLNHEEPYAKAAIALCKKMGWTGSLVSGWTKDGYVFCFSQSEIYEIK